jgi:hypothetical protein
MGMVEEKLQELELSIGQYHLLPLVAQDPAIRVEPQALEFPDPLVPQVEPVVVPSHLLLNKKDVHISGIPSHGMELGQLSLDSFQKSEFETNQVVIDAHPMASIFPMLGFDVLSFEGSPYNILRVGWHH